MPRTWRSTTGGRSKPSTRTIQNETTNGAILFGLMQLTAELLERQYVREDGTAMPIDLVGIERRVVPGAGKAVAEHPTHDGESPRGGSETPS